MNNNTAAWPFPLFREPSITETIEDTLQTHEINLAHIFDPHRNKGGVTIAWRVCEDKKNSKMVEVAVAYCHPQDHYNRKAGAALAVDRFLAGCTVVVPARTTKDRRTVVANLRRMFWTTLQPLRFDW